jgi:hypothetical protein
MTRQPQQELSNQLTQKLIFSKKDLQQLPQKLKFQQMKQQQQQQQHLPSAPVYPAPPSSSSSALFADYYNPEKDSHLNHIVRPPRLPFGHPLETPLAATAPLSAYSSGFPRTEHTSRLSHLPGNSHLYPSSSSTSTSSALPSKQRRLYSQMF